MQVSPKQSPYDLLRYVRESDKKLYEFCETYVLDREFVTAGFTILRPSDDVLTKLIGEMKKVGTEPPDPKFLTQQEKGLAYIFKGAISPGILHASHWYVSLGRRAFVVYQDGNKISIRDSESEDLKKQMDGTIAEFVTLSQIGSSIYTLKGELPKGSEPLRPPPTRAPLSSPLDEIKIKIRKKRLGYLVGGGEGCLPCELDGGALLYQDRYKLMMTLRDGDETHRVPAYGESWASFFVTSFCQFLVETCPPGSTCAMGEGETASSSGLLDAVMALMTGNYDVDALLLLEPMAESPLRPGEKVDPSHKYLVPDHLLELWIQRLRTDHNQLQEQALSFRGKLAEMLNGGASKEFSAARFQYLEHMRKDIGKIKDDEKARITFVQSSIGEIRGLYAQVAKSNDFKGVKAFPDAAFHYLSSRYGGELQWYLPWTMLVFFYCDALHCSGYDKFVHLAQIVPGRNFETEVQGAITGAGLEAGFVTTVGLIEGGFLGYLRGSLTGIGEAAARKHGAGLIIGGGFSHIDFDYREFDRSKKPWRATDRAMEEARSKAIEKLQARKTKRKGLKKKVSKLKKKRYHLNAEGEYSTDEEGEALRITEYGATKKKLKRSKLRKKVHQLSSTTGMEEKLRRVQLKLKRKKLKKHRALKAEDKALISELEAVEKDLRAEMLKLGKEPSFDVKRKIKGRKPKARVQSEASAPPGRSDDSQASVPSTPSASPSVSEVDAAKKRKKRKSVKELLNE